MYISKKDREIIKQKFGGKCAYSGTLLKDDWQVDHVEPIIRNWYDGTVQFENSHNIDNMVPCQKIINHYKGSMDLELFRTWYLGGLHERLNKLPKNPKAEKSIKRKAYLLEVAQLFGIEIDKPFSGTFYFEQRWQMEQHLQNEQWESNMSNLYTYGDDGFCDGFTNW